MEYEDNNVRVQEWTKISRDYVTMHKIVPLSK